MGKLKMFFRLPRLTPGYIRYLQTQATQRAKEKAKSTAMPSAAVVLGAMGLGMSGYSSRQLTLHHRPSTRILRRLEQSVGTTVGADGNGDAPPAPQSGVHTTTDVAAEAVREQQPRTVPKSP